MLFFLEQLPHLDLIFFRASLLNLNPYFSASTLTFSGRYPLASNNKARSIPFLIATCNSFEFNSVG
jgi:hypothetical protein